MEKNRITDEQKKTLYLSLENKCNAPDITYEDIYYGIDGIHPSFSWRKLRWHIPGCIMAVVAIIMIVFSEPHSNWYVIGLVMYLLGVIIECIVIFKQCGTQSSIVTIIICLVLGYVAKNRDLDFDWLIKCIQDVKNIF